MTSDNEQHAAPAFPGLERLRELALSLRLDVLALESTTERIDECLITTDERLITTDERLTARINEFRQRLEAVEALGQRLTGVERLVEQLGLRVEILGGIADRHGERLTKLGALAHNHPDNGPAPEPGPRPRDARWFAEDSPFNRPIGERPLLGDDPRTAVIRSGSFGWNSVPGNGWGHPVYYASDSDPETFVLLDGLQFRRYRIPQHAGPAFQSDAHMHVITPDGRHVDELWGAVRQADGTFTAKYHVRNELTGSGVGEGGTRADGNSALGGLIRKADIDAGEIRSVMAIGIPPHMMAQGFVPPATATDGARPEINTGPCPMGTLFAIDRALSVPAGLRSPTAVAIWRGGQTHGFLVRDRAGSRHPVLYAESDKIEMPSGTEFAIINSALRVVA